MTFVTMSHYMTDRTYRKKIVITGAAGFIGSHLLEQCIRSGHEVIAVDNFITGSKKFIDQLVIENRHEFRFIQADASTEPTTYLPADWIPDIILHFASPASPPKYQKFPIETYRVNVFGTHALAQYLKEFNPEGILLIASTSEVYGDPLVHPQTEKYWGNVNPNGPRSCYDESKRMAETVCGVFHSTYGLDTRIVRIFNTYGPRMDINDGRVIPNFARSAILGLPFEIYGDGSQTRSYCYVDDLVSGILAFAFEEGLSGETINIGNPHELNILQTAEQIALVAGVQAQFSFHALPTDDPIKRKPDITKANTLLSWQPTVQFHDGIKRTLDYFRHVLSEENT